MQKRPLLHRIKLPASLVKCAGSSLAAVAIEFVLLTLLVSVFHMHYLLAAIVSTGLYLFVNFVLNRRWAFRAGHHSARGQFLRHLGVAGGGMAIALGLMRLFVHTVGMPYQLGWALAGCINFGTWTYPMNRFFTYSRSEKALAL